ncbi:hypothetical protein KWL04_020230, partial [Clostridioides difficile]|nr:hypothetical protein [Clostridioides difficile]
KTKTKAEEKIAEVTKLVGKVTADNLEASKVTLKAATDAIEEARKAGWTESEVQSFKGYGDIATVQGEIAALESSQAKEEAKTKAEEKIAEVTKLVGKVTADNLEASKVTLKAATDAIEEAKAAGWTESEIQSFVGYEDIAKVQSEITELESQAKEAAKTKAEEKIAEVTKLVGKVTADNLEASKVTLKAATDAIEEAKAAGWTESEVQSFAGYEDIATVQGEIAALESSQAKEEAKTKAEEKIAEVTKLVGKVTADNLEASKVTLKAATDAIEEAKAAGWTESEIQSFVGYEDIAKVQSEITELESQAKEAAKTKAEEKIAEVTKLVGKVTADNLEASKVTLKAATDAIEEAKAAGWTESEVQSFAGYEDIATVQGEITALESSSQAKEAAKTKAEEKIAEVTKLVGKVTADNLEASKATLKAATDAIEEAKTAGWTESEVQSFAGYEDIATVQGEITALESSSQAKEEAKTKAEEKIAEVTKLVGKVTADNLEASKVTLKAATDAIEEAKAAGWTESEVQSFAGYEDIATVQGEITALEPSSTIFRANLFSTLTR